jgi:hypothetical protein
MLLATSIIVLVMLSLGSVLLAAHAQDQPSANGSQNQSAQKPTEQKQGGEYSGFEETGPPQAGPTPNKNANPTPQAPISGLDVQEQNKTTATAAAQDAPVNNLGSPLGSGLIIGMGALAAGIVVAVSWYFKKRKSA